MFQDTFLDVAIGLIFTFALLSLVTTSVTEGCSNLLRSRSRALGSWIENMLDDKPTSRELMAHPMVRALCPTGRAVPDYISAQTFMMVLLETLAPPSADGEVRKRPTSIAELRAMIEELGDSPQPGEDPGVDAAITLGAPFWFDLLSRFVGLRSAGRQPETNRSARANEPDPREPTS